MLPLFWFIKVQNDSPYLSLTLPVPLAQVHNFTLIHVL
jgi:hypothetical protein